MSNNKYILKVKKTLNHVYADLHDFDNKILASSSTLSLKFKNATVENCYRVGQDIADKIKRLKLNIGIRFDRNGNLYHGRVKSLADGARESGLEF